MNRTNTQLPEIPIPQPPKVDWFSKHHLIGYVFLVLSFLAAVMFIYQLEYKKPNEATICVKLLTTATNPYTGETKEFSSPCDVPKGWEMVETTNHATIKLE